MLTLIEEYQEEFLGGKYEAAEWSIFDSIRRLELYLGFETELSIYLAGA